MHRPKLIIIAVLILASFSLAQPGGLITPEIRQEANALFQKGDWENAAKIYEKITQAEPQNGGALYRLGLSLHGAGRYKEAASALQKAIDIAPNAVFMLAGAKAYAKAGDSEKAYQMLEKMNQYGGAQPESLAAEKDFSAIAAEKRFQEIIKQADIAANPCKASPEFRQFDFWVGEWDAKNGQGITVGTSSIQLILGSCVVFENWSTPVNSGKSFNIYDKNTKKWHQTWVDDKGAFTHYVGELVDGKMVYLADTVRGEKKALAKMTFTKLPNGNVRQTGENSTDGGKTWTTAFDFTYVRK